MKKHFDVDELEQDRPAYVAEVLLGGMVNCRASSSAIENQHEKCTGFGFQGFWVLGHMFRSPRTGQGCPQSAGAASASTSRLHAVTMLRALLRGTNPCTICHSEHMPDTFTVAVISQISTRHPL
eukprot:COSAG02_NODE_3929_length_6033_cov_3.410853_3_plen_124_part_00